MIDTIMEFKKLAETLFTQYPNHKEVVYKKYGLLEGEKPRTLDDTGMLLKKPITRAGVRTLIKTNAENFRYVILGTKLGKKPPLDVRAVKCPPELSEKINSLQTELIQLKISNIKDVNALLRTSYGTQCTVDDSWVKFLLDLLLELKEKPSPYIENIILLDKSLDSKAISNTRDYILAYLRERVIPCSVDDIITCRGSKNKLKIDRRSSVELIRRLIPLMDEVEPITENERTLYQVRIDKLIPAIDKAIRVLSKTNKPVLYATEILDSIHYELLDLGNTEKITIENLKNQLSDDKRSATPRVMNVGGTSQWGLVNDNYNTSEYKELIVRVLTQSLVPLTVQEIVDRMPPERCIPNGYISSTISQNENTFSRIIGNKYILNRRKKTHTDQILKKRQTTKREEMTAAVIGAFNKNGNQDMLQTDLHAQLKDLCPNAVTFDSWLRKLGDIVGQREKVGRYNVWYLKEDHEKHANKKESVVEQIKHDAISIISANNNSITLSELIKKLVQHKFNDRTAYSVIGKCDDEFIWYDMQGKKMVKLKNWEENSPNRGMEDVAQKISEIQSSMGILVEKVNGVDEKLGNFDERINNIQVTLLGEFNGLREKTFDDPENAEKLNQYAETIKKRISEMIVAENFPQINDLGDRSHFESLWKTVSAETREYLTVGEWMWKIFSSEGFDHAHICSTSCRAVELELHNSLLRFLKREVPEAEIKRNGNYWSISNVNEMTIGEYMFVLKAARVKLVKGFQKTGLNMDDFIEVLRKIKDIRNRVSHKGQVNKNSATELRYLVYANETHSILAMLQKLA